MNDDSLVKIMETLSLDFGPAERATKAFESRIASLNKQIFNLKANAIKGAGDINNAFSSQLGQLGGNKTILDQYGQPLKTMKADFTSIESVAKTHVKTVQDVAKQYSILGSEWNRRSSWFLTGGLWYGGIKAAKETVQTISEVEMGVTEIARVMEDETFVFKNYRDELLQLGVDYGQTFDTVQDIALRWAQAGYNVKDSLDNTKTSLLALNTAELNAQNATESLIGIMAQWQMTSNDLPLVLDKINKTADDFTVTSQDLVDGLLRSSGAAKIMGLSLDETISLLTVMREASGRTGREVGNALNSILSYVQRPKSIDTLEGLGIQVFADKARTQFRNVMLIFQDIAANWGKMSKDIQDGFVKAADDAGLYSEELANAIGVQEEWNDLQQRDISQAAAGVYRRNYFIGMIERLSQAQEVLNGMTDAAGYSMRENERTMDTLEKKYTSLKAAAQELAVALGDAGLLDLLKGLTESAKNAADGFADLDDSTKALVLTALELVAAVTALKGVMGLFTTKGILDVAGMAGPWGYLAAAIATVTGALVLLAYNSNKATAQTIEDSLKSADAKQKDAEQANNLIKKYEELQGKASQNNEVKAEMLDIQKQLAQIYPEYADALDKEGNKLTDNIPLLREINALKAEEIRLKRQEILLDANTSLPQLIAEQKRLQNTIDRNREKLASGDTMGWEAGNWGAKEVDMAAQIRKALISDLEKLQANELNQDMLNSIIYGLDKPVALDPWQRILGGTETAGTSDDAPKCPDCGTTLINGKCPKCNKEPSGVGSYSNKPLQNALRLLQHEKHMGEISLQGEIARLKEIEMLYTNNGEERMDIAERIYTAEQSLIKETEQTLEKSLDKQKWLRERETKDYKDTLKDLQDDIKDAYDERLDFIDKEKEKKIDAIKAEIEALDRGEEEHDYDKKMADLEEQEAYWSVRTGEEARKKLADIRKEIAETEHDRDIELKKQGLEDEIDSIEDAAKEEKEKWKAAYKDMEKAFEEHNIDIIAQAAAYSKEAYQQWVDNYLVPMQNALKNGDVEGFANAASNVPGHQYGMSNKDYERFIANGTAWYGASAEQRAILQAENDALRAKYGIPAGEYPKFHTGAETLSYGMAMFKPGELVFPPDLSKDIKTLIAVSSGITGKVANNNVVNTDNRKEVKIDKLLNVENMNMEDEIDAEILSRELNRAVRSIK